MFNWLFGKKKKTENDEQLHFPYETIIVSGEEALDVLARLKAEGDGKFIPVILGAPDKWQDRGELPYSQDVVDKILFDALKISAEELILKNSQQLLEEYTGDGEEECIMQEVLNGEWPDDVEPDSHLSGIMNILTNEPLPKVAICKVPAQHSWEVPAYLQFGDWNACPPSEEHVAIFRYWYEKYGAEIITVTHDVIECIVSRPPQTKEDALNLAKEQFYFCEDIVFQGTENIPALAAGLVNGTVWFFWWD